MDKGIFVLICMLFSAGSVLALQVCEVYDDFNSSAFDNSTNASFLNSSKWEVRQDVEGQGLTDEYWVDENLSVYHIRQNVTGDRRTYLFPRVNFTTGDSIEYDFNVVFREGNYGQMVLLTGDQYIRVGIMGYSGGVQGFDELGNYHVRIEFEEGNFHLERTSPSNVTLVDDLGLLNVNGTYELYVGAGSGHNGRMHMDFDNFTLCSEEIEVLPTCEDGVKNGNETGIDCGGVCGECEVDEPPVVSGDCEAALTLKPGKSKGLWKKGCSEGILKVFAKKIGWAK